MSSCYHRALGPEIPVLKLYHWVHTWWTSQNSNLIGSARQQPYENPNPNVVEYKGLVRAVTSGATTTIHGFGRKLR